MNTIYDRPSLEKRAAPRPSHKPNAAPVNFKLKYIVKDIKDQLDPLMMPTGVENIQLESDVGSRGLSSTQYLDLCQVVPSWIMKKVLALATDKNDIYEMRSSGSFHFLKGEPRRKMKESLYELELTSTILLQEDLHSSPELASLVPVEFIVALEATGTGVSLAPRERAAIVIIQHDADEILTPDILASSYREFLHLKWESLERLLTEAANE
jgi:hypothetical protein